MTQGDVPSRISSLESAMTRLADTLKTLERQRAKERKEDRRLAKDEKREWNRQRGEIANKLGTLVEDMVVPSIARVIASVFLLPDADPLERLAPRLHQRVAGETREMDVVAAWPGHVCIVEVKARLRPEDIVSFATSLP